MPELALPARMRHLPRDKHDRVIPWFVAFIDGEPDFRIVREAGFADAMRFKVCWLCGQRLGRFTSFVIGPMCAVNRVSAEPGSHEECAVYAAQACPFLANPGMIRRDRGMPEHGEPAGIAIQRNPGVALVWTSTDWSTFRVHNGLLIDVGAPVRAQWFARGRVATRAEVLASIETGLPILREQAAADPDPAGALEHLDTLLAAALELAPADGREV